MAFLRKWRKQILFVRICFKMGYLKAKLPIGDRLKRILYTVIQFIAGIVKVPRYILFVFSKSRINYVYFTLTIIVLIVILVNIFQWLGTYNKRKLTHFEQQIESLK